MTRLLAPLAYAVVVIVFASVVGHVRPSPDESEMTGWFVRVRNGRLTRPLFLGAMGAVAGFWIDWYLMTTVLPALRDGGVAVGRVVFGLVVGVGLGASLARHVVFRDYNAVGRKEGTDESLMQRPVPWAIAFVLGSMTVGPVVLSPPWWDEFRRQQQLGFAIGVVTWGLVAVGVALLF